MLYVLREKGGDNTRAVWGRQLEFILTREGYAVCLADTKRFKRTLIYYDIENTMQIYREITFFRPQNDTLTTVKRLKTMKNDMRGEVTYLLLLLLLFSVLA